MGRREERLYRRDSCSEWDRGRGDGCGTGGAATTVFLSGERNIYIKQICARDPGVRSSQYSALPPSRPAAPAS